MRSQAATTFESATPLGALASSAAMVGPTASFWTAGGEARDPREGARDVADARREEQVSFGDRKLLVLRLDLGELSHDAASVLQTFE